MLKEQERKEENLMKFSFIQGCKKKFFQSRNICAQIGSSNRACVCVCVCVCVHAGKENMRQRKNAKCTQWCDGLSRNGRKANGPLAQIMKKSVKRGWRVK